jgi:hypothetical protein
MADRFEADVKSAVAAVARATQDMQRVAGEIMTSVNGTSERAAAAAAASEEASASVGSVLPPPKSLPLPSPRSAVRSAIPAASPMPPWARRCKPPKWSAA